MALVVENIAGEVPPFRFEIPVRMMISRKLVLPARLRRFPIGAAALSASTLRSRHCQHVDQAGSREIDSEQFALHSLRKIFHSLRRSPQ